jgi:2-octaprenylphenol hydroxylase
MMVNFMQNNYDIAIVGGGTVGLALACALVTPPSSPFAKSLRIVILEGRSFGSSLPENKIDSRVSAITRASENILKAIGAWSFIPQKRMTPYGEMKVWEECGGSSEIHFNCAEIAEANLGHIVENHAVQFALFQVLTRLNDSNHHTTSHHPRDQNSSVEMICPASLLALEVVEGGYLLKLDNELTIKTSLVVGADGASSSLRELSGINTRGWDYQQSALVSTVKSTLPHQQIARQRFLATGPLAFLPLSDPHTSSIVWSTTPEEAIRLKALDNETFCHELTHAFELALGNILSAEERMVFPLRMQHVNQYVKPHLALVGDAAHTLHPLAGQGVNLGLLDAACLADVIHEAVAKRREWGSLSTLRRYERWRKGHNLGMIGAMECFKQLFSNDHPILKGLRNTGLTITNRISPLKNLLMRQAMGSIGELPSLAKKRL